MKPAQRLVLLLILLFSPTPAGALAAPANGGLAADLARLREVTVGPPIDLPGRELAIGRALIKSVPGDRIRPLRSGQRTVGVLIEGRPLLTYRVEDAFSIPVAKRNLRTSTGLVPRIEGSTLRFEKSLTAVAAWGIGLLPEPAEPIAGADGGALPAWLAELLVRKTDDNPERDLLLSMTQGDKAYRWAVFHAAGDDYLLDVDTHPAIRREVVRALRGRRRRLQGLWRPPLRLDTRQPADCLDVVGRAATRLRDGGNRHRLGQSARGRRHDHFPDHRPGASRRSAHPSFFAAFAIRGHRQKGTRAPRFEAPRRGQARRLHPPRGYSPDSAPRCAAQRRKSHLRGRDRRRDPRPAGGQQLLDPAHRVLVSEAALFGN